MSENKTGTSSSEVNFKLVPGINAKIDGYIKSNFPTLESLLDADITELTSIQGIGDDRAISIKDLADEYLKQIKIEGKEARSVKSFSSKDDMELVIVERMIDKNTTKRTRREVTPAVCRKCGLDFVEVFGLDAYDSLDPLMQGKVKESLKKHLEEDHSISEEKIVRRSDLKETDWLRPNI